MSVQKKKVKGKKTISEKEPLPEFTDNEIKEEVLKLKSLTNELLKMKANLINKIESANLDTKRVMHRPQPTMPKNNVKLPKTGKAPFKIPEKPQAPKIKTPVPQAPSESTLPEKPVKQYPKKPSPSPLAGTGDKKVSDEPSPHSKEDKAEREHEAKVYGKMGRKSRYKEVGHGDKGKTLPKELKPTKESKGAPIKRRGLVGSVLDYLRGGKGKKIGRAHV